MAQPWNMAAAHGDIGCTQGNKRGAAMTQHGGHGRGTSHPGDSTERGPQPWLPRLPRTAEQVAEPLLQPCHCSPATATVVTARCHRAPGRMSRPFHPRAGGTPIHYGFGIKEPSPSLGKPRHRGARQGRAASGGSRSLPGKGHQSHHVGAGGGQVAEEGPQNPQEAPAQNPTRIQPEGQRGQKRHGSGDPAGCHRPGCRGHSPRSCPGCHPGEQQGGPGARRRHRGGPDPRLPTAPGELTPVAWPRCHRGVRGHER